MATFTGSARNFKHQLQHSADPLGTVLSEQQINEICKAVGHVWRDCFWRPAVVLLTFLRQVLLRDCSCRQAVALTLSHTAPTNRAPGRRRSAKRPSADPSAYSQARQRLPLALLQRLSDGIVQTLHQPDRLWHGHRVRIVDGSGISMPDTPALQRVFPQSPKQKPGCGFPTARLLGVFCWASGALLHLRVASLAIGEINLLRRWLPFVEPDDVILGDRHFGNYTELALIRQRGAHGVFRVNAARRIDFRRGVRLGPGDQRVVWDRPRTRPQGLPCDADASLPESLEVRIVRVPITQRGYRTRWLLLVTTLLDPITYPPEALAELYHQRWLAELNLRSLKTTLGMDVLRCQSPPMVRKEILMFQIAYNLIRAVMRQAARVHQVDPHRLSFAGCQHRILAALLQLPGATTPAAQRRLVRNLLADMAGDRVPLRPHRKEPHALKRRHKVFPYLTHPRPQARTMSYYDGL